MRIDLSNNNPLQADLASSVRPGTRADASAANSGATGNSTELSSNQLSAAALTAAVEQVPEVRQDKVAALGGQVRSGTYQVSAEQTAEAMISEMQVSQAA